MIEFVNETDSVAYFHIYRNDGNTNDTLRVELLNDDKSHRLWMGYGHSWNKENITNFISNINKLELISDNDTVTFTDKNEMYDYLKKQRKGIFRNIIRIEFNDINLKSNVDQ